MKRLERIEAVNRLSINNLASLDTETRESYILNWWGIDEDDEEFSLLSEELKNQMLSNDDPPSDVENCKYDQLIKIALCFEYKGVTNTYLSESMAMMGLGKYEVCGDVEVLEICPCCSYRTLSSRGDYNICGLCDWEDNGVEAPEMYSGPNHMTLAEGKDKFREKMSELPLSKWVKA